jgi:hypothetical protein
VTTSTLHSRAMLVKLSISTWTARRFDKLITAEVNESHGASEDAGRYNKHLLSGESFKAVSKIASDTRTAHYANTLAWTDEGWRLLPTANWQTYTDLTRALRSQFDAALSDFVTEYPRLKELARTRLNGMYKDSDYPAPHQMRDKYKFSVDFSPIPSAGDFRLDLPQSQIDVLEAQIEDRVTVATSEAMREIWDRLYDTVEAMKERLGKPGAIFRDSLVYNARELTELLKRLNVTGDANLEAMRVAVRDGLTLADPQTLRTDSVVRAETAQKATQILSAMSSAFGTA